MRLSVTGKHVGTLGVENVEGEVDCPCIELMVDLVVESRDCVLPLERVDDLFLGTNSYGG
jgi:hypothetical protein